MKRPAAALASINGLPRRRSDRRRLLAEPREQAQHQHEPAEIERGRREVLAAESQPGGRLDGVGAIVIECTIIPQFREVIRDYTPVPVYDAAATVTALLG